MFDILKPPAQIDTAVPNISVMLPRGRERERETDGERHPASTPQGLIKRCDEAALLYCSMWGLSFCSSPKL